MSLLLLLMSGLFGFVGVSALLVAKSAPQEITGLILILCAVVSFVGCGIVFRLNGIEQALKQAQSTDPTTPR